MALDDMNEGLLQVTNHKNHPTNVAYKVFYFKKQNPADIFEKLLLENKILFEKDSQQTHKGIYYMFGIRKTDLVIVKKLNYLALGKTRKPFMQNIFFKYVIICIGLSFLLFSIISYFNQ